MKTKDQCTENMPLSIRGPAAHAAAQKAFRQTVRGNVYLKSGLIYTERDVRELKQNAALLDVDAALNALRSEKN